MNDTFRGTLSGSGLNPVQLDVQMAAVQAPSGVTVLYWLGQFSPPGTHTFATGQRYRLELEDGRFYDIEVTEVRPLVVEFRTL